VRVLRQALGLLFGLALGACGAPAPPRPPGGPTAGQAAAAEAPAAAVAVGAWLAWRQDVGGVVRTALIEQAGAPTPGAPAPAPRVTVATRVLLAGGGEATGWRLFDAGPATTRWSLNPCGEDALAFAKGLRARQALPAGSSPEVRLEVSDPALRPVPGANAEHREFVSFVGQSQDWLWVRHVTRSGPCPLGQSPGLETLFALDLARGTYLRADGKEAPALTAEALKAREAAAPAPVHAFWETQAKRDQDRIVEPDEVGRYGGVGWALVPPEAVGAVRARLEAERDAPTPSGPTDWD
jgi:hypothetical protein